MELAEPIAVGPRPVATAPRGLLIFLVLGAMALGGVELAQADTQQSRCRDLATSDHPTDYISFEIERCRGR